MELHNACVSKYFTVLEISSKSDQEQVRQAFLKMVKRFHPDSGSAEASAEKFLLIENAYRKLQNKFANDRWNANEGTGEYGLYHEEKTEIKEFDIKHTVPQHRQYLSYGGYGMGTPQKREKQYQKYRAQKAIENVHSHRISKIPYGKEVGLIHKDKCEAQKIKLRSEMDRLVEDLIQESISRGEFDNLAGAGKPLKHQASNPYVDFVTHKMNQVLINNGFTPEWISLQKEISDDTKYLRESLTRYRTELGHLPLDNDDNSKWNEILIKHKEMVIKLNAKIDKYNLLVPLLQKQKLHILLQREADCILKSGKTRYDVTAPVKFSRVEHGDNRVDFLGFLSSFYEWNEEVRKRMDVRGLVERVEEARMKWYGHVKRMGEGRIARQMLDMRVTGTRPRERP
ncbi:dnaJ homolog subfamily C member 28 isoform X2 [Zootermopsis nevadensis]|uniref:dnaJ homolog subfamily C member 28 isoform X2 n=1 Tax=Zootermopsis nevadensis TaxID=136037 RepID=UPI000B8E734A|nr:dnaJ homolog subfamily C member 28 isoform X2 [Zootermopsis nevadensis]XP_021932987.1 dnaJ homolog subfamily C member 28 isoform X2 [Zootermopsis nevadensis]XP_021932988.1 dnaJ homolog subfamily C member 28 isoform X2 [Zootermopsis nevadensis]